MVNRNLYLILASGEINGIGFWLIDTTFDELTMIENKNLLECHRKELISEDAARDILFAIKFNLSNLLSNLQKEGFNIDKPPKGITFNIPLDVMESIFDFWLETYKNKNAWQTSLGLLKIKKRVSLYSIIKSKAIKNHVKDLAYIIEKLHTYRPNIQAKYENKDPMWK